MEKFFRVAYTCVKSCTYMSRLRGYTHDDSLCVSQDETAEFDVNLTHFAESIEKIAPALLADRNHRSSVLARLPLSLFCSLSSLESLESSI